MNYKLLRQTRRGELVFHVVNDAFWIEPCEGGYRQANTPDAPVYATSEAACDAQATKINAYLSGQPAPIGYCHYCGQPICNKADAVLAPLGLGGYACRECQ